jgi:hypothetical protein
VKGGQFVTGLGEPLLVVDEELEAEDPTATEFEMDGLLVMTNCPRI